MVHISNTVDTQLPIRYTTHYNNNVCTTLTPFSIHSPRLLSYVKCGQCILIMSGTTIVIVMWPHHYCNEFVYLIGCNNTLYHGNYDGMPISCLELYYIIATVTCTVKCNSTVQCWQLCLYNILNIVCTPYMCTICNAAFMSNILCVTSLDQASQY